MLRSVVVLLCGAGLFFTWRTQHLPSSQVVGNAGANTGVPSVATNVSGGSVDRTDGTFVDTAASVVRWRGTKFGGRGAHAGVVRLKSGTLDYNARRAELRGARFDIDMRSIAITDMPIAETSARNKLLTHLLAADFFDVANHPTARFDVRRVTSRGGNLVRLDGELTLRGVTRAFGMDATVWSYEPTRLHATARATLDRMQWGVAFRGSRLTNDLVDDLIHLELDIVARVSNSEAAR
jgi:polyisoprenoid-binding protein YceI